MPTSPKNCVTLQVVDLNARYDFLGFALAKLMPFIYITDIIDEKNILSNKKF